MDKATTPWKQIIEFHKEIAIRSEESFFSFNNNDMSSERVSFIKNEVVQRMQVDSVIRPEMFSNQLVFSNMDQKNTEFYIGGIFWFTNKKIDGGWIKCCHPLFYKPFAVSKNIADSIVAEPEQAKWDVSPMFYKLLDKKGLVIEGDIDEILLGLIEEANATSEEDEFEGAFISLFVKRFPEIRKEFVENAPRGNYINWLIFVAPKDFSAIQRNLILDYAKLMGKLDKSLDEYGGFELFEKHKGKRYEKQTVMPIVPLNDNQLKVVEKIISGNEITVVSGPPGCGKSQVVLSILLNAWEKDQTALFASSNNQAVDVVRERMRKYERHVPMVVRSGSRKNSELQTIIKKMISIIDSYDASQYKTISQEELEHLEENLKSVTEILNSNLPQRIDELLRAAFRAYGKAGEYKESREAELELYAERLNKLKIDVAMSDFVVVAYKPFLEWAEMHSSILAEIKKGEEERNRLNSKIRDTQAQIINGLDKYYINSTENQKITEVYLQEITDWYNKYKQFLLQFIEMDLQEAGEWEYSYDNWNSSTNVQEWINMAEEYVRQFKLFEEQYGSTISDINEKYDRKKSAEEAINNENIRPLVVEKLDVLKVWRETYSAYLLRPKKFMDGLPFSEKSKTEKQMRRYETQLIELFGSTYLTEIATEPTKRRNFIAKNVEAMIAEFNARQKYTAVSEKIEIIQKEQKKLNELLGKLAVQNIFNILNTNERNEIRRAVAEKALIAKEAKAAFEKREKRAEILKQDREFKFKGSQILYPLMEGINKESEVFRFFGLINGSIYTELTLELLNQVRVITYKHIVEDFFETLGNVQKLWNEIESIRVEIQGIKEARKYQIEWMNACPESLKVAFRNLSYTSSIKQINEYDSEIKTIYKTWKEEGKQKVEKLTEAENQEYEWVWDSIKKALDLCPENILPESREAIVKHIKENGWDVNYIRSRFSKINSQGMVMRQARVKSALEDALLTQSVINRMASLADDNEIKAALTKLYMDYKEHGEVITKQSMDVFQVALKALPLWITTGQSPQSIPMQPGVFDLLIIDEATQCTITSILPLIYRCKKIVVIGDMEQLTAIDNISINTEKFIADKFGVENYLYLLGHCGCNIYKSVLNMIPVKEGNVISLTNHYRSHPLIIGFSNYYVYKNRLVLKKPMKEVSDNKVSGVFGLNVNGQAYRDSRSDSWCNECEANEVVNLIQKFKEIPEYKHYSIGIITPFRGQVKLIHEKLEQLEGVTNILVSTVHKYQGDEKDIIIFSPVVAQGMTSGATKWVEKPQNLINVAVTRAREALYVVSDFEVCRRQPGILGNLIEYVEKIELLRKTSAFELQLFGLITLQGWGVEVHPVIKDIEVDFIVSYMESKVVIEVDGRQHEKQKVMDSNRDAMLAGRGYDVIRIPTREIADTPFETIERIRKSLKEEAY